MKICSHIAGVVGLFDILSDSPVQTSQGRSRPTASIALSKHLGLKPTSVEFGKALLWTSAFVQDGRDAINRSQLPEEQKTVALSVYDSVAGPFVFPFGGGELNAHKAQKMNEERRSYLGLLDGVVMRDFPIVIPDPDRIIELTNKLTSLQNEFEKLDIPLYIKEDFKKSINLYCDIATKLPMVAHRLISEESGRLISWLLSALPDDSKKVISRTAVVLGALATAFVVPAEMEQSAQTYYRWYSEVFPLQPALEATVVPKALPPPDRMPVEKPNTD